MNYQYYFVQMFIFEIILGVLLLLSVLFIWFNNSYLDQVQFFKNNTKAKVIFRIIFTFFLMDFFFTFTMPFIKDKKIIDTNTYYEINGIATYGIVNGGAMGLSKSIIVQVDDKEYEFSVAWADSNIEKGSKVKVTYLPNSKYAVVELE